MFVPPTLWPFNVQDVLADCLAVLEKGKRLNVRHRLLIELLPEPPDETICAAVAGHELHVQKGAYENLVKTQAKYSQNELAIKTDLQLRSLDQEALRLGLKGEKKHEFLCAGLGWVPGTSPKRISRLRAEFKNRRPVEKTR
jgi:hypothetical protein